MSIPSNGITQEVIRDMMPPYQLSADLLASTVAALPPPPQAATQAARHAHLTRLIEEIVARQPADADQARDTAQLLIIRELAETCAADAHTSGLTVEQRCRLARTVAELLRSATSLQRTLTRHQQKPVPFFGTVVQDAVDLAALDEIWRKNPSHHPAAPREAATTQTQARDATPLAPPAPEPPPPSARPVITDAAPPPPKTPDKAQPHHTPTPKPRPIGPTGEWTITQLDSGPGWTREVLRHRSAEPGNDTGQGPAT